MSKAYDKLMEELEAEQNAPAETPNTETPAETPAETPKPEEHEDAPKPEEQPVEQPAETPNPEPPVETPKKRPSEYTPEERAHFAFQRQLAKEREKHARELEDLKKGWESKFEELKKATKQPEPKKTRADFPADAGGDDAYIDYLVKQRYESERAADAEKAAKEAEERAKQQAEQDEQNRILQAEQQAWLTNVDTAFGEDKARSSTFLKRVEYCMSKGLGEVLDACPVASDFLLHSARGPVVFEALLNDRAKFERVFNERSTPMDQYYELRQIENELKGQPSATPAPQPTPAPAPMPHLGKPGKGGNATEPDIFSDEKAMRSFLRRGH
jgi:hypothetical protein